LSDRALGALILLVSLIGMALYVWWLLLTPVEWVWFGMQLRWWAVAMPVLLGVLLLGVIAAWIGWTMATTPPPPSFEELEVKPPEEEAKPKKKATRRKRARKKA
jgi:predicted DNA-binding transcriptional regulator